MGDSLRRLHASIKDARQGNPDTSRTTRLLGEGVKKMSKKLAEEAIEVGFDAIHGDRRGVILESADLLYNLSVLWVACGIELRDVMDEIDRRERLYGIAEKLPKSGKAGRVRAVG
jgi:phosphoribosyl-ATP pyrophosphohydrolase